MKASLIISGVISFVVASVIIYIAIDHNPMEAYCENISDNCRLNLLNISGLWATWFVAVYLSQVLIIIIFKYAANFFKK